MADLDSPLQYRPFVDEVPHLDMVPTLRQAPSDPVIALIYSRLMIEKSHRRLRESADGALRRVRTDGGQLVARVGDSYREWASDDAVSPAAPEPELLPVSGPGDSALLAVLIEHDPLASGQPSFAMERVVYES